MHRVLLLLLLVGACAESSPPEEGGPPPMSIEALRAHAFDTRLEFERPLDGGESFSAYLVSYRHAGLKLHAMVAVPNADMPDGGWPVVIANHGYVPDPRRYGITADGIDSRPGDYYRSVPELFASRGFLVVLPDGHRLDPVASSVHLPVRLCHQPPCPVRRASQSLDPDRHRPAHVPIVVAVA